MKLLKTKGVTLVEMMVSIAIISLITIAIGNFSGDIFSYNKTVSYSLSAQQDARQVLRVFSAELRSASPSANGSYALEEVGVNAIKFYSDVDKDGAVEQVRYYLSGSSLMKDVKEPSGNPATYNGAAVTTTLVKYLANGATPIFTYFDTNYGGVGASLTQPVDANVIRLVKINLQIEQDPNKSPNVINVTTQVSIRNLKDNL
jgi:prepilin-type N-terminal cleavage/methylation domain-containing protein